MQLILNLSLKQFWQELLIVVQRLSYQMLQKSTKFTLVNCKFFFDRHFFYFNSDITSERY